MFDGMGSRVRQYLLPKDNHHPEPPIPANRVSLVTIKIRYLIEELIPVEIKVLSSLSRRTEWDRRVLLLGPIRGLSLNE
jgi:hypothetical protein